MRLVKLGCRGSLALALVTSCLPALLAVAADKPVEQIVGPFTGTVVDSADTPVAGATVWLIGGVQDDPHIVAQTTSDGKGRFQIAKQIWPIPSSRSRYALPTMLAARDSSGRIGGSPYADYRRRSADNVLTDFRIKLQDVKDCHGCLVDMSGQAIAQATVRPTQWFMEYTAGEAVQQLIYLPGGWAKELTVETGLDGRFTLHNWPTVGRLDAKIRAEGFGEPGAGWKLDKSANIQLGRVGSVQGTVRCDQNPKAVAEIGLQLEPDWQSRRTRGDEVVLFYRAAGVTNSNGAFQFRNVPPGKYVVKPELADTSPYYNESSDPIELKSKETATVSLALKPAVKLQGKVVDQETGAGVPGVRVWLYFQDGKGTGGRDNPTITDREGAFTLYARPGRANLQVYQFPDQYIDPSAGRQQRTIEVQKDATLEPIRLQRASVLEGFVVDKAGKPVPDAEIRFTDTDYSASPQEIFRTDAAGRFTLKKIAPKRTLIIRARTKTAIAEPVNIVPAELKEPLRLVVDEKTAFTLRGTVTDDGGKPLPRADVGLTSHWSWAGGTVSFQSHTCKTDDAGRFEFGGLWPGDRYQISVSAKDYEKYGSPMVNSTPGGLHDFGKIAIQAANGAVKGTVVDSAGKAISGVRVFNVGDGPKPIETLSDDAGGFRLQGLRSGPVFIFAEKAGFRFGGLRTNCGATKVAVKMRRNEEPLPQWSPPSPASRSEEEQRMARKVLEKFLATGDNRQQQWARSRIARMDRRQPPKQVVAHGPRTSAIKRSILKIAGEDLDEALSLLPKKDSQAYDFLRDLAQHFASSDPEKAMRCATEAVVRARNLDQPDRSLRVAQMGALVARLGNKEAALKLAHEAAQAAAKWQVSDRNYWVLDSIAQAVAACDVEQGVALLGKISKTNERDRHDRLVANVAASLDDVEKAESLLKEVQPSYANEARMRLAYRIAAKRPAEAVRLIERIPENDDENRAKAFGWLAVAIAPGDRTLAHSMIDRSFAILLAPSDRNFIAAGGGRPAQAAILALAAEQIGYPDMESVVYRVLATRATASANDFESPVRVQECNMMMALYLALIDPAAAKQVLQAIEPHSDCIGSGYSGISRTEWFKAWALVDPQHTVALAEREIASAKDPKAKQAAESGLMEVVELWLTPSGDRLNNISGRYRHMFPPTEES